MRFPEAMIRRVRDGPLLKSIRQVRIAVSEDYWYHYFVEYYKGYRIDRFSTLGPNMHGIYVGTADPETIPKAPPDPNFDYADWVFYDGLQYARAGIDNWVIDPIYVQHYPNVTWATHVDPGWDIYQEPAGGMRYYALDKATGNQVGTWWTSDNLQGLLDWIDETQVPTGEVASHEGIPIRFILGAELLSHYYEATVKGEVGQFDNWRLQDCKTWIEEELAKPPPPPECPFSLPILCRVWERLFG